jgi:hypothetical protein
MSAEAILSRCQNVRKTGPGRWICSCPAHEDKNPSMNVRELPDLKVLMICRAGCTNREIVEALGLHWSALFPESDIGRSTYDDFKREAARIPWRDVLEAVAFEAQLTAIAASNLKAGVVLSQEDLDRLWQAAVRLNRAVEMTHGS